MTNVIKHTLVYHQTLNKKLWDGTRLKTDVRSGLLKIANKFIDTFGFAIPIRDIVLTGSSCNYNWTRYSDLDLHIIVDMSAVPEASKEFIAIYLKARKQLWNDNRKVTIKGLPVELYAQNNEELLVAAGVYSLTNDKWVQMPNKIIPPKTDHPAITAKAEDFVRQVDTAILESDNDKLLDVLKRIADFRKAGLAEHGEFGVENLTFKILRNNGTIKRIKESLERSLDKSLTVEHVSEEYHKQRVKHFKGTTGGGGGLTSYGRWKKRRVAKLWSWKRRKGAQLAKEKPASGKTINRRTYLASRHGLYKSILHGRQKSKLPYGERKRTERTGKRLYRVTVATPQTRTRWKTRRRDDQRHQHYKF